MPARYCTIIGKALGNHRNKPLDIIPEGLGIIEEDLGVIAEGLRPYRGRP